MSARQTRWLFAIAVLLLLLLAFNFLSFRLARSTNEVNHTLGTYRAGQTLPDNMASGFTLHYAVRGPEAVATALEEALAAELEALPNVGTATLLSIEQARVRGVPFLLVDLTSDRLWMPFYARAALTGQLYFAYDGDAPWPLDEPVVMDESPALQASGNFTLTDSTTGLISRPAYNEHLAQRLAQAMAAALQNDVFTPPQGTP